MLSCLYISDTKRCMLGCLLVFRGLRYGNHVRGFVDQVRFVNLLRIEYSYPQVYWNANLLLIEHLDPGQWTL